VDVAVVGLGKIGLPLAVQIAGSGNAVVGCDISADVVEAVLSGVPHFPGEAHLAQRLAGVLASDLLRATTDTAAGVKEASVVIIVVPLVVDEAYEPDYASIDAASRDVGRGMTTDTLVIYETTMPVGTTRTRFGSLLEAESGMVAGEDFWLAHSPERVYSGRVFADLRRYPKLVGGVDPTSEARAADFYRAVLEFDDRDDLPRPNGVWPMGGAEAAELAKLAETTYRDVNIALANEFAMYAERIGLDAHAVIAAANSQPFANIHRPGIAVGGHCIPVYPRFYLTGDPEARLPLAGREINEAQPAHAVKILEEAMGGIAGRRVVVLGASYRGGVKETAFSGARPLVDLIEAAGGDALVHDPLYTASELTVLGFEAYAMGAACDAAIVQADHAEYRSVLPGDLPGCRVVYDGRRMLDAVSWRAAGVTVLEIGVG
jgi:nucleotide sugar dehydrogenase